LNGGRASLPRRRSHTVAPQASLRNALKAEWEGFSILLNAASPVYATAILVFYDIKIVSDFPIFPVLGFSFSIDCYVLYQLTKKPYILI
jgi:hypothetical protein